MLGAGKTSIFSFPFRNDWTPGRQNMTQFLRIPCRIQLTKLDGRQLCYTNRQLAIRMGSIQAPHVLNIIVQKSLKIPKGKLELVNRRRTDNTMAKEKGQRDKRSSNKNHTKTEGELRCSGRENSSCSTSDSLRDTLVTDPSSKHVDIQQFEINKSMKSVTTTTKLESSITSRGKVYTIQLYVKQFTSDLLLYSTISFKNNTAHHERYK